MIFRLAWLNDSEPRKDGREQQIMLQIKNMHLLIKTAIFYIMKKWTY